LNVFLAEDDRRKLSAKKAEKKETKFRTLLFQRPFFCLDCFRLTSTFLLLLVAVYI